MRRRLYLMRHGAVAYFAPDGRPFRPDDVPLTAQGRAQAEATRALLAEVELDRVIATGLPRTQQTAELVAPGRPIETQGALREIMGAELASIPAGELEEEFVHALHGVVPNEKRFLGGETVGELFDRVLSALEELTDDRSWDTALVVAHGAVNRAILSYVLTGERVFLGRFEQAPGCLNVIDVGEPGGSDWIVRAVNIAASDLVHRTTRLTQMEQYWAEMVREGGEPPPRT